MGEIGAGAACRFLQNREARQVWPQFSQFLWLAEWANSVRKDPICFFRVGTQGSTQCQVQYPTPGSSQPSRVRNRQLGVVGDLFKVIVLVPRFLFPILIGFQHIHALPFKLPLGQQFFSLACRQCFGIRIN